MASPRAPQTSDLTPRRTPAVWALAALLLIQGLGGLGGGIALVTDVMHMPLSYLRGSPFPDYRVPGLILGLVLGVFPLIVLIAFWMRREWAWYGAFTVGCGLMIWIVVEVAIIPYNILQPLFGAVGVLIALLTLTTSVQRWCGVRRGRR